MRKSFRSIGLFLLLIGPFSMFFILSKGSHEFQSLPFLFEENSNGVPSSYKSLQFISSKGEQVNLKNLDGKILIVSCFAEGCPNKCAIDPVMMRFSLFTPILETKGFNDVVMLSECEGNDSSAAYMQQGLEINSDRWIFVKMPPGQSFFNIKLNKHNPYQMKDPDHKASLAHHRSVLLIDKERRIRGFYDVSSSIEYKRIMQELRLLKKQYSKEKLKKSKK